MGDGNAVVYHRNAGLFGGKRSAFHLFIIEHASAAVDDQRVLVQIVREALSGTESEFRFHTRKALDPARYLDRTDIIALPVMRAPFRDQDFVAGF